MEEVLDDRERYAAAMYDELIRQVRAAVDAEWQSEEMQERLAIMEFDGNMSRSAAEAAAACVVIYGRLPPIRDVRP